MLHYMDQETRVLKALEAIREKSVPSNRKTAELFEVPRSTLQDCLHGAKDLKTAHKPFQHLSVEEEASMEQSVLLMSIWS
jgi:hypothetical protein